MLTEIQKAKAEQIHSLIRGIIAIEMGYANQTKVCKSAEAVFNKIGQLTYQEFRLVKKYLSGCSVPKGDEP
jgi:hypothetical protein